MNFIFIIYLKVTFLIKKQQKMKKKINKFLFIAIQFSLVLIQINIVLFQISKKKFPEITVYMHKNHRTFINKMSVKKRINQINRALVKQCANTFFLSIRLMEGPSIKLTEPCNKSINHNPVSSWHLISVCFSSSSQVFFRGCR